MRPLVPFGAFLLFVPLQAHNFPTIELLHDYMDGEVPQLEHARATAGAVLALGSHADCLVPQAAPAGDADPGAPRTIVSAACALASIPRVDRMGDYTANVSVAGLTQNLDSPGVFLPRAAKGAEITLFPSVPCGASARFGGAGDSDGGDPTPSDRASPVGGQCNVDAAMPVARGDRFASGAERFSIFAAPGDAIQDWRDTPAPTQEPRFPVYDEEWAVGCLGLSSELWECYSLVPSRRDRAGEGIPVEPGWTVDRHAEVLAEKRLLRGEIDWDSEVPLCDVPVFDAAAEARAHPDVPLHELFSERYRREGAQTPVLILNDPSNAEFETMDRGMRPENVADEDNPGALLLRNIDFAKMKRGRFYNRLWMALYRKEFLSETPTEQLRTMVFPAFPDPVCLRDPRKTPHINIWTGERGSELFFARNVYHIGSTGTGTPIHAHRASWLRLHGGTKIWFFYPPKSRSVLRSRQRRSDRYLTDTVATTWLLQTESTTGSPPHPRLNFSYAQSVREGVPPLVCIQQPNTFMFVEDDWYHGIVNVGLNSGTAVFSQGTYTNSAPGTPEGNRYIAEYPAAGHTVRSRPDE
jgi:hypothetical protein